MKMCHISINGVPHCEAPISRLCKEAGLTAQQVVDCTCMCGYGVNREEAEADAARLAAALPSATVKVVDGDCGSDPWWSTPEGRSCLAARDEYERDLYRS
jgi:hypothetical protein